MIRLAPWALALFLASTFAVAEADEPDEPGEPDDPAEELAARLETVHVTGTRLRRIDLEGPLPITVIDRAEIEASGHTTLSDFLRTLPFNSFGTSLDEPNQRVQGQRLLNLRGLGPEYTLVLLDGQRLPGNSAVSGGAVTSVAGLPMAAIERVEVLRDGASAVYGSEAIGGVVNLVTRRGTQPLTAGVQLDRPSDGGGQLRAADLVMGRDLRDGDWLVALQVATRDPLRAAQRPYLVETAPLSFFGAPGSFRRSHPDTGAIVGGFEPDPRCPGQPGESELFPSSGRVSFGPDEVCGYRFRDDNFEQTGLDSLSAFASLRHALSHDLILGGRVMAWRNQAETELAASPATVMIGAESPFNPTLGELGPGRGFNLLVPYRLTPLGPRRSETEEDNLHAVVFLDGYHGRVDWLVSLHHNWQSLERIGVSGFALADAFQSIIATDQFDPFTAVPGDPGVLAEAAFESWLRGRSRSNAIEASAGMDLFELRYGPVEAVTGVTLRRDRYRLQFDAESQRGNVIGSPGGAEGDAGRTHVAAFIETLLPLAERVEANLALRYDHYQDSGDAFSPRLALAWRPVDGLLLRGALGRGFRVIDLQQGYAATTRTFSFVVDQVKCAEAPGDPQACAFVPIEAEFPSNPELDPELARQVALGMVWQPWPDTSLGLDFYRIRLRDQIGRLSGNEVALNELACLQEGRPCDPLREGLVERDAFGNMALLILPAVNIAEFRTSGVDLDISQGLHIGPGRAAMALRLSRVLEFERRLRPDEPAQDALGLFGRPRFRAMASAGYLFSIYELHAVARHVGRFRACFDRLLGSGALDPLCEEHVRSHTEFDLRGTVELPWDGRLAIGVRNLANREAPLTSMGELAYRLHDIVGRVPYLRYEQRF